MLLSVYSKNNMYKPLIPSQTCGEFAHIHTQIGELCVLHWHIIIAAWTDLLHAYAAANKADPS